MPWRIVCIAAGLRFAACVSLTMPGALTCAANVPARHTSSTIPAENRSDIARIAISNSGRLLVSVDVGAWLSAGERVVPGGIDLTVHGGSAVCHLPGSVQTVTRL